VIKTPEAAQAVTHTQIRRVRFVQRPWFSKECIKELNQKIGSSSLRSCGLASRLAWSGITAFADEIDTKALDLSHACSHPCANCGRSQAVSPLLRGLWETVVVIIVTMSCRWLGGMKNFGNCAISREGDKPW
jgi:hypothetical protein